MPLKQTLVFFFFLAISATAIAEDRPQPSKEELNLLMLTPASAFDVGILSLVQSSYGWEHDIKNELQEIGLSPKIETGGKFVNVVFRKPNIDIEASFWGEVTHKNCLKALTVLSDAIFPVTASAKKVIKHLTPEKKAEQIKLNKGLDTAHFLYGFPIHLANGVAVEEIIEEKKRIIDIVQLSVKVAAPLKHQQGDKEIASYERLLGNGVIFCTQAAFSDFVQYDEMESRF
ncbi:MAG: hypothetical protein AB7S81_05220 [Bdellovibrionales bacterium]